MDPWELLSTADFIFFSPLLAFEVSFTSGMATEIMLVNDTSKVHLQPPHPPSQIGPNQRTLDVPQYCRIQIFKNLDEIQLFPMSALNSDCLSKGFFFKGFLVPEAF